MQPVKGQITANSAITLLARVTGTDGTPVTSSTVSSVAVNVYDLMSETNTLTSSPAVADVVYDTLQTDTRWTTDSIGYNLAVPIAGSAFPDGDNATYRVEITVNPTDGDPFILLWDLQSTDTLGG